MSSFSLVVFRDDHQSRIVTRLYLPTFPHIEILLFLSYYDLFKIKFIGVTFQRMTSSWTATSTEMCMSRERQTEYTILGIFFFQKEKILTLMLVH